MLSTMGDGTTTLRSRACRPIYEFDGLDSWHAGFANPRGDGGGGGTGTGTGGGGGVAPGGAAGAASAASSASTASTAGSGTAGVGNLLPWLYPTADFRNFDKYGAVGLPAIGATAVILQFVVDNGRNGKITQMGIDFVIVAASGAQVFTQGLVPAQLIFQIAANGKPFKDYEQFPYSPGAVSAPTPINGLMLKENDVITVSVKNVSIAITAASQFLSCRLLGYNFSKNLLPKILGLQ